MGARIFDAPIATKLPARIDKPVHGQIIDQRK